MNLDAYRRLKGVQLNQWYRRLNCLMQGEWHMRHPKPYPTEFNDRLLAHLQKKADDERQPVDFIEGAKGRILALIREGLTYREISDTAGYTTSYVSQVAIRAGIRIRRFRPSSSSLLLAPKAPLNSSSYNALPATAPQGPRRLSRALHSIAEPSSSSGASR